MAFLSLFAGRSRGGPVSEVVPVSAPRGNTRAEPVFAPRRSGPSLLLAPANTRMPSVLGLQPQTFARGREVAALLLWTFAVFLCLGLGSYAGDPAAPAVTDGPPAILGENWVGPVGAAVAKAFVTLVGVGPGDAELITIKAQRKMMEADVIIYDGDTPPAILEMARRDATRVIAPPRSYDLEKLLVGQARAGKLVVRLISGAEQNIEAHDEYVMLRAQGVLADVVPGLSSFHLQNDSPFPIDEAIQDSILRSAS